MTDTTPRIAPERDPTTFSPVERLIANVPPPHRDEAHALFMDSFDTHYRDDVLPYAWEALWARPNQLLPVGEWETWVVRAGRGYGKTRTGAEAVRKRVTTGQSRAVTIIGPTPADARDVMIEGPDSGLLAVHPPDVRPDYEPSKRLLTWPNGAIGHVRSGADPDSLRGLQSDTVWGDEPATWRHGEQAWDNAMLGLRIGRNPKSILTGTPRPLAWLRKLEEQASTRLSTGATYENLGNLAPAFIRLILERYEGTHLGRQELHALYLDDVEGALWAMSTLEQHRLLVFDVLNPWANLPPSARLERVKWEVRVGVDPPGETAECGIIVGAAPVRGRAGYHHAVIVDDQSLTGPPEVWGSQVVRAAQQWNAVEVVVEANQGGDMVRAVIHAVNPRVNVRKVHAKESKYDRAEPVSTLYARGWVHHHGHFAALENQMTTWVPGMPSPDRMDALVHLVTAMLRPTPIGRATAHTPVARRVPT